MKNTQNALKDLQAELKMMNDFFAQMDAKMAAAKEADAAYNARITSCQQMSDEEFARFMKEHNLEYLP